MGVIPQAKRSIGLSIILAFFTLGYAASVVALPLMWMGVQSYDPQVFPPGSHLFYALTSLIGIASLYGIWKWKKWGVYGLAGTWVLTGIINMVFGSPGSNLGFLLITGFFLLLLPAWQRME